METFGRFVHKFEIGEVRTSDSDVESFVNFITHLEDYISFISSNKKELNKKIDEILDKVMRCKAYLDKFLNNFNDYAKPETINSINAAIDEVLQKLNDTKTNETDTAKKCAIFPQTYRKLLDIVPVVIAIENSKYEKCNYELCKYK